MPSDSRPAATSSATNGLTKVLYLNGFGLLAIAAVLLLRGGGAESLPLGNIAQAQVPIAGGGGVYLMPAQLASNIWGVYLLDTDEQTIMVYKADRGGERLTFEAARNFTNDRLIDNFNTEPSPDEVKAIVERSRQTERLGED